MRLDEGEVELQVAESLEAAGQHSVVYVGQGGAVVAPAKVRAGLAFAGVFYVGSVAAAGWLLSMAFGWPGLVGAGVFGLVFGRQLLLPLRLRKVASLMVAERYGEAEALAESVRRSWPPNRVTRREALNALVQIASVQGQFQRARKMQEEAEALYRYAHEKRSVQYLIHRYGRVVTLCNLGELGAARKLFVESGEVPEGDYLRLLHWTCELLLAFCEGQHELDDEALHARGRRGLEVVPGTPLLALAAWGFEQSGDGDMAQHLLSVVDERWEPRMARALPRVAAWLAQHGITTRARRHD